MVNYLNRAHPNFVATEDSFTHFSILKAVGIYTIKIGPSSSYH